MATKAELKAAIDKEGGTRNSSSPHWKAAFEWYNRENSPKLNLKCSSCFRKAYAWLQK